MVMPQFGLTPAGGQGQGAAETDEEFKKRLQAWLDSQLAGNTSLDFTSLLASFKTAFPTGDETYLKEIATAKGILPTPQVKPQEPQTPLPGVEVKPGLGPTWEQQVSQEAYAGAPWGQTAEQERAAEQERLKKERERLAQEQLEKTQEFAKTQPQPTGFPGEVTPQPSGQLSPYVTTSEDTYLAGIKDLSAKLGTTVDFPGVDMSQMSSQERRIYRDQLRDAYRNLLHLDQQRQLGHMPQGWSVTVNEPQEIGGVPWNVLSSMPPEQQQQILNASPEYQRVRTGAEIQAMRPDDRATYFAQAKKQYSWGKIEGMSAEELNALTPEELSALSWTYTLTPNAETGAMNIEPKPQAYSLEYTSPNGWKIGNDTVTDPQGHIYTTAEAMSTPGIADRIAREFHPDDVAALQAHAENNPADFFKWMRSQPTSPFQIAVAKAMGLKDAEIKKIYPDYELPPAGFPEKPAPTIKPFKQPSLPWPTKGPEAYAGRIFENFKTLFTGTLPDGKPVNPYAPGGPLASMAVHPDNMSDTSAALSLTFMAGMGIPAGEVAPLVNIAGTTPYIGKTITTALGFLGVDTSAGIVPDYIQVGISKALGGIANKKVASQATTYLANAIEKGETLEQMVKGLSTITGMTVENTKDALTKAGVEIITKSPVVTGQVAGKVAPAAGELALEAVQSEARATSRQVAERMLLQGRTPEQVVKTISEGQMNFPKDAAKFLVNDVQKGLEKAGNVERRQAVRAGAEKVTANIAKQETAPGKFMSSIADESGKVQASLKYTENADNIRIDMIDSAGGGNGRELVLDLLQEAQTKNKPLLSGAVTQSGEKFFEDLAAKGDIKLSITPEGKLRVPPGLQGKYTEATQTFKESTKYVIEPGAGAAAKIPEVAQKVGGVVPPVKPPAPPVAAPAPQGSELAKVEAMWQAGRAKTPRNLPEGMLKLQEQLNDTFYGLRTMQTRLEKGGVNIEPGGAMDIKTALTRVPGVSNAGATRYLLALDEIKKIAPNAAVDDINSIIYLSHAKEIMAEKGPERVMAGGFTDIAQLDTALSELQAKLGVDGFNEAMKGAEVVKGVYGNELTRMVDAGLVDKDLAEILRTKYPWYNPLQYLDDAEKLASQGKSAKPFSVISSGLKRLQEKGTTKAANDPLSVMAEQLVKNEVRIHKNETAKAIINVALEDPALGVTKVKTTRPVAQVGEETVWRPYKGDIPGTLSFFENGKRQVYEVPDWIYREAETLTRTMSNPISSLIGSLNGISRAAFTSASPPFVIANMLNDSIAAFVRGGIMPWETGTRLIQSLKGLENDKVMQMFKLAGGSQARFYGADLAKEIGRRGGGVLSTQEPLIRRIWKAIPQAGEAGEQAPRMASFLKELDKTLPNWKQMTAEEIAKTPQGRKAAANAVELTINFGRGGYLVKSANPFIIFLNANMEGMKLPFRALREIPAAKWRLAGMFSGLMGLSAYNMSYPEYFDVPNNIRWGSVMIMLPSKEKDEYGNPKPNYITVIPRTREWSLFFGSGIYAMEKLYKHNPTDFGTFSAAMAPMLVPFGAEIPMPAVIAELAEQGANWDYYRSQPIVPQSMANVPPAEQVQPWISPTIAAIASRLGQSPMRWQHAFTGLFGGAGQTFVSIPDYIGGLLSKDTGDPRIVALAEAYQSIENAKARRDFLAKYASVDKNAILAEARKPQPGIPVVTPILRRVYPEQTGQIYRTQRDQVVGYVNTANEIAKLNASKLVDTRPKITKLLKKFNPQEQALIWRLIHVPAADKTDFAISQLETLRK